MKIGILILFDFRLEFPDLRIRRPVMARRREDCRASRVTISQWIRGAGSRRKRYCRYDEQSR